jgi:hypothetical protein
MTGEEKIKDKILKEVLEWHENQENKTEILIEDFIELIINKTVDEIFYEVKNGLKNEFDNGNLKHPFIISSDYYLDLKLKEIKGNCISFLDDEI